MALTFPTSPLSPATMITRLEGMLGCSKLDEEAEEFVSRMVQVRDAGTVTRLTPGQLDFLKTLHDRYFA